MSLCSGDLILLCDQDDCWLPEKIESVARIFNQDAEATGVVNDTYLADGSLQTSGHTQQGTLPRLGYGPE